GKAAEENIKLGCGYTGPMWGTDREAHFSWCFGIEKKVRKFEADNYSIFKETGLRTHEIERCKLGRTSQPLTVDTGGSALLMSKGPSNLFPRNMPKLFPPSDGGPCGNIGSKLAHFGKLKPKVSDLLLDEPAAPILKVDSQAARSVLSISVGASVPSAKLMLPANNAAVRSILSTSRRASASANTGADPCPGDGPKPATATAGPGSGSASTSPTGSGGYYLVYPDGGPNPAPKKTTAPSGSASTSSTGSGGAYQSSPGKDVPKNSPKKNATGSASTSSTGSGGAYQSSPGKDVPRNSPKKITGRPSTSPGVAVPRGGTGNAAMDALSGGSGLPSHSGNTLDGAGPPRPTNPSPPVGATPTPPRPSQPAASGQSQFLDYGVMSRTPPSPGSNVK